MDDFELDLDDVGMDINVTSNEISTASDLKNDGTSNNTSSDNDDAIEQALNAVADGVDAVNEETANSFNENDMQDFFKQLLQTFNDIESDGNSPNDDTFDNALKNIMSSFFDPLSLREPVEIIVSKYPKWLNDNKDKLKEKEYENYEKQYGIYLQAWNLIKENEKNNNPAGHKDEIMDLLLKVEWSQSFLFILAHSDMLFNTYSACVVLLPALIEQRLPVVDRCLLTCCKWFLIVLYVWYFNFVIENRHFHMVVYQVK